MVLSPAGSPARERDLLTAARAGDEAAYRGLVEPRRAELHAHCYRMLGSVQDAEDAVQETLLRAWRALPRFEGRSSLRAWLYTIATNACLNGIARRPKRVLPAGHVPPAFVGEPPGRPLVESVWIEPYADEQLGIEDGFAAPEARYEQRESLELAFVAALQHLSPRQRAALILREVLGFSAEEAAACLETTVASVNSALQRARKTLGALLPAESQQTALRSLGDERVRKLAERYADAIERADVETLLALLTEDAVWSMPPLASWYTGRDAIAAFLVDYPLSVRWRHLPTQANGQVAIGCYMWNEERGCFAAEVIDVLTLRDDLIGEVTAFISADIFTRFGLPAELPPQER
jgi:RNA polymerase sigma-70 factor (ECF subfamily)